ncbi:MAG: cobaltochelatase subunit CobN, partial [Succiniclasticum sp.]
PSGEILIGEVMHLLRLSNGPVPSLYNLWAEKFGISFEETEKNPSAIIEQYNLTGGELLRRVRSESRAFITVIAENGFTEEAVTAAMNLPETAEGPAEWQEKIKSLATYVIEEIYPRLAKTTDELEHTLAALSGKYIPPGPSGSPSAGGVDLLPSGRNFYGVDPRALPSQA